MKRISSSIALIFFITLIVLGFQNCSSQKFAIFDNVSTSASSSGNGQGYDGLNSGNGQGYDGFASTSGVYYLLAPNYFCRLNGQLIQSHVAAIDFGTATSPKNPPRLSGNLCSGAGSEPINPLLLLGSVFNLGYITYNGAIFVSPQISTINSDIEIPFILCRDSSSPAGVPGSNLIGLEFTVNKILKSNEYRLRVAVGQETSAANIPSPYTRYEAGPVPVGYNRDPNQINLSAQGGFEARIQYADMRGGYPGTLNANIDQVVYANRNLTCEINTTVDPSLLLFGPIQANTATKIHPDCGFAYGQTFSSVQELMSVQRCTVTGGQLPPSVYFRSEGYAGVYMWQCPSSVDPQVFVMCTAKSVSCETTLPKTWESAAGICTGKAVFSPSINQTLLNYESRDPATGDLCGTAQLSCGSDGNWLPITNSTCTRTCTSGITQ